jgi:hypothetical protein
MRRNFAAAVQHKKWEQNVVLGGTWDGMQGSGFRTPERSTSTVYHTYMYAAQSRVPGMGLSRKDMFSVGSAKGWLSRYAGQRRE